MNAMAVSSKALFAKAQSLLIAALTALGLGILLALIGL